MNIATIKYKIVIRLMYAYSNCMYLLKKIFRGQLYGELSSDFKKNGIVKIKSEGISEDVSKMIASEDAINQSKVLTIINRNENGVKGIVVDLEALFLWTHIFNDKVYSLISKYYEGAFYLRNLPTIVFNYDNEDHGAQNFHVDWGLRQLSIMVSLTDVLNTSTHMEYLLGSANKLYFRHPDRLSNGFKKNVKKYLNTYPQSILKTLGQKDDTFIFDAGNGYHRQVGGGSRIMLHLNFVENLAYTNWDNKWGQEHKNNEKAYWSCNTSRNLESLIKKCSFPLETFSLVLQQKRPSMFIPELLSKNWKDS